MMTPWTETIWVAAHRHLILLAGVIALQVVQRHEPGARGRQRK